MQIQQDSQADIIFCKDCHSSKNYYSLIRPCNCFLDDYIHQQCLHKIFLSQPPKTQFYFLNQADQRQIGCKICNTILPIQTHRSYTFQHKTFIYMILLMLQLAALALVSQLISNAPSLQLKSIETALIFIISISIIPTICLLASKAQSTKWRFEDSNTLSDTYTPKEYWIKNEWIWADQL